MHRRPDMQNPNPALPPSLAVAMTSDVPAAINIDALIGPGASEFPAPATQGSGAADVWEARWAVMYERLQHAKMTEPEQAARRHQIQDLQARLVGCCDPNSAHQYHQKLLSLLSECEPPARSKDLEAPLWACSCEFGLILVHSGEEEMLDAVNSGDAMPLVGTRSGGLVVRLNAAAHINAPDSAYFSWAAEGLGWLFILKGDSSLAKS